MNLRLILDLDLITSLLHPGDLGLAASHLAQLQTPLSITSALSQQVFFVGLHCQALAQQQALSQGPGDLRSYCQ